MKNFIPVILLCLFAFTANAQTSSQPKKKLRVDTISAGQPTFLLDTNVVSYKCTWKVNQVMVSVNKTGNVVYTGELKNGEMMLIEEVTIMNKQGQMMPAPSRKIVVR